MTKNVLFSFFCRYMNVYKEKTMYRRILFLILTVWFVSLRVLYAQSSIEAPQPVAIATDKEGNEVELSAGETSEPFEAPLTVRFSANAGEYPGYSRVCRWSFKKSDEQEDFLIRYDAEVEYEFVEAGAYTVSLYVTYTSSTNSNMVLEYEYDPYMVSIAESSLKVPNAFSPNGDGINDYFNVYDVKSIISFNAAIYNRWGQQLYSWGIDEMTCEECGWDGTYKGKPVKDGVYFVVVSAKGADGITYDIKRDVNLLRRYIEETNN